MIPFLASSPAPAPPMLRFTWCLNTAASLLCCHTPLTFSHAVPYLVHPSFLWLTLLHSSTTELSHHVLEESHSTPSLRAPPLGTPILTPVVTSPQHLPYYDVIYHTIDIQTKLSPQNIIHTTSLWPIKCFKRHPMEGKRRSRFHALTFKAFNGLVSNLSKYPFCPCLPSQSVIQSITVLNPFMP